MGRRAPAIEDIDRDKFTSFSAIHSPAAQVRDNEQPLQSCHARRFADLPAQGVHPNQICPYRRPTSPPVRLLRVFRCFEFRQLNVTFWTSVGRPSCLISPAFLRLAASPFGTCASLPILSIAEPKHRFPSTSGYHYGPPSEDLSCRPLDHRTSPEALTWYCRILSQRS